MQIDDQIWTRIQQDDREAFSEAYRFFYKRFFNYGKKFSADDQLLEDVIQETLLLIWEKRKTLATIKYVQTYFFSAFRNALITKLKSDRTHLTDKIMQEPDFSIEQIIIEKEIDKETREKLQKAISGLTSRQREAIFLRFYEGLPYNEVATILNITTKATYKIVGRAIDQLRELIVLDILILIFPYLR